jgi:hypothetical protein
MDEKHSLALLAGSTYSALHLLCKYPVRVEMKSVLSNSACF